MGQKSAIATGVFLLAIMATPALARSEGGADASDFFRVEVRGTIAPKCRLIQSEVSAAFRNPASSDNTAREDTAQLGFNVDCNTGFSVSLSSLNGGLKSPAWTSDPAFTNLLAYTASVVLPDGVAGPTCGSAMMIGDGGTCLKQVPSSALQNGVITGAGHVDLKLTSDGRALLAGEYSDRLVLTLSPTVSGAGGL